MLFVKNLVRRIIALFTPPIPDPKQPIPYDRNAEEDLQTRAW